MANGLPSEEQVIEATFNDQLLVGLGMIALCVLVHGLALFTLQRIIFHGRARKRLDKARALSPWGAMFTLLTVFALIFVHFLEIWIFALLYDYLGALRNFQDALYFSTISYATIGYDDALIAEQWRMVAALEGLIGIILLGWSTAFFVRLLSRLEGHAPERRS